MTKHTKETLLLLYDYFLRYFYQYFGLSFATYSHVPIRRGVRNKRSGTQDEK